MYHRGTLPWMQFVHLRMANPSSCRSSLLIAGACARDAAPRQGQPPSGRKNQRLLPQRADGRTGNTPLEKGHGDPGLGEKSVQASGTKAQAKDQAPPPDQAQSHRGSLLPIAERTHHDSSFFKEKWDGPSPTSASGMTREDSREHLFEGICNVFKS